MLVECPECSQKVSTDAKQCIHCGCNVRMRLARQKQEHERTHEPCHNCKKDKLKSDKTCPHCGAKNKTFLSKLLRLFFILSGLFVGFIVLFTVLAFLTYQDSHKSSTVTHSATSKAPATNVPDSYICRAGIAMSMMKGISIVKVNGKTSNYYNLSYIRASDGSRWGFRCYIQGNRIIWSTDGRNNTTSRWRTSPNDEKLSFHTSGNKLIITNSMMGQKSFPIPSK